MQESELNIQTDNALFFHFKEVVVPFGRATCNGNGYDSSNKYCCTLFLDIVTNNLSSRDVVIREKLVISNTDTNTALLHAYTQKPHFVCTVTCSGSDYFCYCQKLCTQWLNSSWCMLHFSVSFPRIRTGLLQSLFAMSVSADNRARAILLLS